MKQLIIACITALATGSAFGMHSSLVEEKVLGNVKDASETAGKAAAEQRMLQLPLIIHRGQRSLGKTQPMVPRFIT